MSVAPGARDDDAVLRTLEEIVRDHLHRDVRLTPDLRLTEALELDSLRLLTLVVEVENRFRICLDEHDEEGLETVADLLEAIGRGR